MSSFQRAVCAKLPCGGQQSIWRRSEAWSWSRTAPDSRRNRTRCVSADSPGLTSLDKWEIFAAEVICPSRASRIILERRWGGNYALATTCWSTSFWKHWFSSLRMKKIKNKNQFSFSSLYEVFCLNGARRRQTTSIIRHGWRTADTTGTLGYLEEYRPM